MNSGLLRLLGFRCHATMIWVSILGLGVRSPWSSLQPSDHAEREIWWGGWEDLHVVQHVGNAWERAICTVLLDPRVPLLQCEKTQGFTAAPSTEGQSVCLCWAPSKPEGPKGSCVAPTASRGEILVWISSRTPTEPPFIPSARASALKS